MSGSGCEKNISKQANNKKTNIPTNESQQYSRRDFLEIATTTVGTVGACCLGYAVLNTMNPAADVQAESEIEVDLSNIPAGQAKTVKWRGQPVFIRHRTKEQIAEANNTSLNNLIDPETDNDRVQKSEWLIVIGVCTHLGCVPTGQKESDNKGDYNGWFCPCHGSAYDISGRVRKGPAPKNLKIPPYTFINDKIVCIGKTGNTQNV